MSRRVLVVGDVVDDVLVRAAGPAAHGSDTDAAIAQRPGGSAANVAAWLGYVGTAVTFVGRAGAAGTPVHVKALTRSGVDAYIASDPQQPTGTIVLLVDDTGERTMYVDRGANAALVSGDLPADVWEHVALLHLTGYSFFDPSVREVAADLIASAAARGVELCIDPSSAAYLRRLGAAAFLRVTRGAGLAVPNAEEAAVLTGLDDPERAGEALLAHYGTVVVTCGARGVVHCTREEPPRWLTAPAVRVVDTTGAGDAFCAGLLAARLRGADVAEQLAAGVALAAGAVQTLGARPG